jgi:Undecaprenyl-phosphate glucose phosphotransferase
MLSRVSTLHPEAERVAGAAIDEPIAAGTAASNVIELDTPQTRRGGGLDRAPRVSRPRIDPRGIALALRLSEAFVVAGAGAVAYRLQASAQWPLDLTTAFAAVAVMAMVMRFPNTEPRHLHESMRRPLSRRLAEAVLRALLPFVFCVLVVIGLAPVNHVMRAPMTHWLTLWAMGAVVGLCTVQLCFAGLMAHWRSQGRFKHAVAIFGTGDLAERLLERLQGSDADMIELVGVFDDRSRRRIPSPAMRGLALGTSDDLITLSQTRDIDRILVALPHAAEHRVIEVLNKLRRMPIEISLAPDMIGYNVGHTTPDDLAGLPMMGVHRQPLSFSEVLLKSMIDKCLAGAALLLGSPLLLLVALAIKLDSKGPVFFRQNRHGFGDRVIRVFKFRTMTHESADQNGEVQSRPNDPRVTRVGRFLRQWSLDELPQLLNVLSGEMSLVGPRPHAISMRVEELPNRDIVPEYAMRHHVKPGITGWAQVNGFHGPVATQDGLRSRVRYDLEYIDNWSIWFDFQIMLRTLKIVLGQRHAY